jgi:predicted small secreted protein
LEADVMTRRGSGVLLTAMLAILLAVTACNTVEGAGQDIKNAGSWIERKAGDKK